MSNLKIYADKWSQDYTTKLMQLDLFQPSFAKSLSLAQKQDFIRYFYHIRGNFYKFLWFMGSFAPDIRYKKSVQSNITEEFGVAKSHEEWYLEFALTHGVDLKTEIIQEKYNLDFIKTYNKAHIDYIINHHYDISWSTFSAYEKLDNVDYPALMAFAENIQTTPIGLTFFRIHANGNHYTNTEPLLEEIWNRDSSSVIAGFEFVACHQLEMWQDLSRMLDY
jgi:Iron-containing redox enzyme